MDGDVLVKKSFDPLLNNGYFTSIEFHAKGFEPYKDRIDSDGNALTEKHVPGFALQAAVFGAEKNHPLVQKCMEYYEKRHFVLDDGSLNIEMLACDVYALAARNFGFRYKDEEQNLESGIKILNSDAFAGTPSYEKAENYAVHCCNGSWRKTSWLTKIKRKLFHRR